jgi:hypothetical protein
VNKVEEAGKAPTFISDHLYLVAFLICGGHEINCMSRDGRRVSFGFLETHELLADVANFMSDAAVPVRRYTFELLKLKRMLNGGQNTVKRLKNENQLALPFDPGRP